MAQVQFILVSGDEVNGVIQGKPGQVSTQISEAMTGTRPVIVYDVAEAPPGSMNIINPAAIAAVRVMEEKTAPTR